MADSAAPPGAEPPVRIPPAYDYVFVFAIALVALLLRVANLADMPAGFHGDEASSGLDAVSILNGDQVFPYTGSALGQPAGFMYVVAPFVEVMGRTVEAVRLPSALIGVATVVAGFFAVREMFGRPAAWIAAILLAFSSWLIFYNRTGYSVTTMPMTQFLSLLALAFALRSGRWYWGVAAGVVIGAGIYGYFAYPLFAIALAIYVAARYVIERPAFVPYVRQAAIIGAVALAVTIPMWPYLFSEDKGYRHDREEFSLTSTQEWRDAGTAERAEILWDRTRYVVDTLMIDGVPDIGDGSGVVAALDPIAAALTALGLIACGIFAFTRRNASYLLPLIAIPLMLLGPIFSEAGAHRRGLGVLPMAVIAAAVLLAHGIAWAETRPRPLPAVALAACGVLLVLYAGINVRRYFDTTMNSDFIALIYAPQLTLGIDAMNAEPPATHVYFASGVWAADYETVRFLAQEHSTARGNLEDRSREFAGAGMAGLDDLERPGPAVVLLFDTYQSARNDMVGRYPGSTQVAGPAVLGLPAYILVRLPAAQ